MNARTLKEYCCTRSDLYSHDCLGRDNPGARQGHYVQAENARDAWLEMHKSFPGESNFTIEEIRTIGPAPSPLSPDYCRSL